MEGRTSGDIPASGGILTRFLKFFRIGAAGGLRPQLRFEQNRLQIIHI